MDSRYDAIFDDEGVPFFGGPRPINGRMNASHYDVVIDGDGTPRFMGSSEDIVDWFYDIGKDLKPRPFKVLMAGAKFDRYLSLDEYFEYCDDVRMPLWRRLPTFRDILASQL